MTTISELGATGAIRPRQAQVQSIAAEIDASFAALSEDLPERIIPAAMAAYELSIDLGIGSINPAAWQAHAADNATASIVLQPAWGAWDETMEAILATGANEVMVSTIARTASAPPFVGTKVAIPQIAIGPDGREVNLRQVYAFAAGYARQYAAARVTQIGKATRQAIAELIVQAFDDPLPLREAARLILEIPEVGLNRIQAGQLIKYTADLYARGYSEARVRDLTRRRFHKLRRARSILIARTEAEDAAAEAQVVLWRSAAEAGAIDPKKWGKMWVTIRPCWQCVPYDGMVVSMDGTESFEAILDHEDTPPGRRGTLSRVARPLVHPNCQCYLVPVDLARHRRRQELRISTGLAARLGGSP